MRFTLAMVFLTGSALVTATLKPARSHTKGMCPRSTHCDMVTTFSPNIQATECSHNTRTHNEQTYAVFVRDHRYDHSHGAPYGNCSAYTTVAPTSDEMVANDDCLTLFWVGKGAEPGFGTPCIMSPLTGFCGCEDSATGTFHPNKTDCV